MKPHSSPYCLAFAAPALAQRYRRKRLRRRDYARLQHKPQLENRLQWRTSRALLAELRDSHPRHLPCLSHKNDHALIALGKSKPGADLEYRRPRDYLALARHSFHPQENAWLAAHPDPQTAFYQLWTLKEALIKAENLRFPTHLSHVGLIDGQLFSPGGHTYRWLTLELDTHWIASAVWTDSGEHLPHLLIYHPQAMHVIRLDGNLALPSLQHHAL